MSEFTVRIFEQSGEDDAGRVQVHTWAEVPRELAGVYLTGGLRKIRKLTDAYFSYRFSPRAAKRVRGRWTRGEPSLSLNWYRIPFVHGKQLVRLGRLRSAATNDVYRGYFEILGGEVVSPAAILEHRAWPEDLPWVAPSAGEFDIHNETERPPYLGIFETRVQRTRGGCTLHVLLLDFPATRSGLGARMWQQPWHPMTAQPNLDFLRKEITSAAREGNHTVRFEKRVIAGTPTGLRAARIETAPAVVQV
jgi:hypothetical protein